MEYSTISQQLFLTEMNAGYDATDRLQMAVWIRVWYAGVSKRR